MCLNVKKKKKKKRATEAGAIYLFRRDISISSETCNINETNKVNDQN